MKNPLIPAFNCILIYADGSCSGNPGPGGYAAVLRRILDSEEIKKQTVSGGENETTNIRMEMQAIIAGLKCISKGEGLPIIVRTDSQMIVRAINEWLPGWIVNNWWKSDGKPVSNRDLWEQIIDLTHGRNVAFEWVRGHAGDPMNAEVDRLAVVARNKRKTGGRA